METDKQTTGGNKLIRLRCGNQRHGKRCEKVLSAAHVGAEGKVCYSVPLHSSSDRPGYSRFPAVTEEKFWLQEYDRHEFHCRNRCGARHVASNQSLRQVLYAAQEVGQDFIYLTTMSKFPKGH